MRNPKVSSIVLLLLVSLLSAGQEPDSIITPLPAVHDPDSVISIQSPGETAESVLTLLFTGDIMGHDGQIASAYDDSTGVYSYDSVFKYISPLISAADIATGNLEVTLGGMPYKGYPAFSSPDALATACMNAGFDILTTANNHAADRGPKGISRTIRVLDSLGVRHTGTWVSEEARDTLSPLIIDKNGIRLALLNYTYGTNGIVVPPPAVVSYIDTIRIAGDIRVSEEKGADLVIVYFHWGNEYDTLPSAVQKQIAAFVFRSGADIIIGSHPHVIQPMTAEADTAGIKKPVVWSMGNFVSNQRQRRRDGGAMITLELTRRDSSVIITDAGYILTWVYRPTVKGKQKFYIIPCPQFENNPGFFKPSADYDAMMVFINDARRLLDSSNKYFPEIIAGDDKWVKREPHDIPHN